MKIHGFPPSVAFWVLTLSIWSEMETPENLDFWGWEGSKAKIDETRRQLEAVTIEPWWLKLRAWLADWHLRRPLFACGDPSNCPFLATRYLSPSGGKSDHFHSCTGQISAVLAFLLSVRTGGQGFLGEGEHVVDTGLWHIVHVVSVLTRWQGPREIRVTYIYFLLRWLLFERFSSRVLPRTCAIIGGWLKKKILSLP